MLGAFGEVEGAKRLIGFEPRSLTLEFGAWRDGWVSDCLGRSIFAAHFERCYVLGKKLNTALLTGCGVTFGSALYQALKLGPDEISIIRAFFIGGFVVLVMLLVPTGPLKTTKSSDDK